MKLSLYTNENTQCCVIHFQQNDGDDIAVSKPKSPIEYEIYKNLHLAINSDGGEEQLRILVEQLENEIN